MRYVVILLALAAVMFLAREQLGALMPSESTGASGTQGGQREYVQHTSKTPEQCAEELGSGADEEALLRCTTGTYSINTQGIR